MTSTNIPVYQKIAEDIRSDIISGKLRPGSILPSENDLRVLYNASRETVRKGLRILDEEHLIYSRPRRGYFVSEPQQDELRLLPQDPPSISEDRFKDIQIVKPSPYIQQELNISADVKVVIVYKGTYCEEEMYKLEVKYIPYQKGHPSIEKEIHFAVNPEAAAAKEATFETFTKVTVRAVTAPENVAKLMKCSTTEPLLLISKTQLTQSGIKVSFTEEYLKQPFGILSGLSGYVSK